MKPRRRQRKKNARKYAGMLVWKPSSRVAKSEFIRCWEAFQWPVPTIMHSDEWKLEILPTAKGRRSVSKVGGR